MSDVLAALAKLDEQDKREKSKGSKGKGKASQSTDNRRMSRATSRPRSLPTPRTQALQSDAHATPRTSYERSPSQGRDSRRISFVDSQRPTTRQLQIPTRGDSITSGFPFDPKLRKYGVSEKEWDHFCGEIIESARASGPSWLWPLRKNEVVERVRNDLLYEGDMRRVLKRWNRLFKTQQFQAWLELPLKPGDKERNHDDEDAIYMSKQERRQVKRDAKRFRIVISADHEKAPSVYSRSSSLTRSVAGEGAVTQATVDSSG